MNISWNTKDIHNLVMVLIQICVCDWFVFGIPFNMLHLGKLQHDNVFETNLFLSYWKLNNIKVYT